MWRNNPSNPNAEEPPADHWIWKMWNAYDEVIVEPDEAKRNELFAKVLDVWYEELPMAGFLSQFVVPVIMRNGMHNHITGLPSDNTTNGTQIGNVQTLYWDEPEKHS